MQSIATTCQKSRLAAFVKQAQALPGSLQAWWAGVYNCRSQIYPSLSLAIPPCACHAPLSRITTAAGERAPLCLWHYYGLLLGLAYAPGRSTRLIIITGGTSLRYCQKAETLETVSNSEPLHYYTLLTYPVDRFLFFHPASISLLPLFPISHWSTSSLERLLLARCNPFKLSALRKP